MIVLTKKVVGYVSKAQVVSYSVMQYAIGMDVDRIKTCPKKLYLQRASIQNCLIYPKLLNSNYVKLDYK